MGHRISDDIDVFLSGVPLASLTSPRNPFSDEIDPKPQWPGHYLKFERSDGEVDFLSSALQTSPGYTIETFRGRTIALETVDEVIVKKVRYRGGRFTPRDAFDLACALEAKPEVVVAIARETADALPRLGVALEVLARRGNVVTMTQVRPMPAFSHIVNEAVVRAQEGLVLIRALAERMMGAEAEARLLAVVEAITWFRPGTRPGTIAFDWDPIDPAQRSIRLAMIDERPAEAKAMLLQEWRKRDPHAFDHWDAGGRLPSTDQRPVLASVRPRRKDTAWNEGDPADRAVFQTDAKLIAGDKF